MFKTLNLKAKNRNYKKNTYKGIINYQLSDIEMDNQLSIE